MKDALMLLPGMMCDARIFTPQIEFFSAYRTIVVAPMTTGNSFSSLANDILASAPSQFALAGFSMGGIAAMEIIRQAPDRVTKLALLDTNPRAETLERQQQRESQIASVLAGNLKTVMRDEMKPNYLSDSADTKTLLNLCMDMAIALGPEVFVTQSQALQSRSDQTSTLCSVRVPTLVLCGEDDRLCPVTAHEEMQQIIPSAALTVIAGAGHMPTLEQSEKTNEALEIWLNK
ncbi:MAG: alpha/beta hydrolase [Gammaproteobacteria bacterium]|nr:alpha/beta hydrolase [Gammaproteobacteria bacterium]